MGAKAAYELFPGGLKSRLQVRCLFGTRACCCPACYGCFLSLGWPVCEARDFATSTAHLACYTPPPCFCRFARLLFVSQKERKNRWAEKQRAAVANAVAAAARFAQEHPPGAALSEQVGGNRAWMVAVGARAVGSRCVLGAAG